MLFLGALRLLPLRDSIRYVIRESFYRYTVSLTFFHFQICRGEVDQTITPRCGRLAVIRCSEVSRPTWSLDSDTDSRDPTAVATVICHFCESSLSTYGIYISKLSQ